MRITSRLLIIFSSFFCTVVFSFAQAVSEETGNVYFTAKDGRITQLTSSGLDSDPSLSTDGRFVVFVRRTPSLQIETGAGETAENELWIASTTGADPPRRVLVGHTGGFAVGDNLVLAGFHCPQFAPDGKRVYFVGRAWATSNPIFALDLISGDIRFLYDGVSVEVITSGQYAGYLIAHKQIPRMTAGRVFRYWLLDADGNEVGEIGETESDVGEFKQYYNSR